MSNINKIKKVLMVLVVLILVGLIIFLAIKLQDKKETNKEIEEKVEDYIKHKSYDEVFSIKTPSTWKQVENKYSLNEHAILELYNENKNSYLVSVVTNKMDVTDDFNTFKQDVFTQKITHYNININEYKDVVINNYNCQYIEFYNTNSDSINTYIRAYAIETENYYVQILIWTLKSNEQVINQEFDNIINSFKEI